VSPSIGRTLHLWSKVLGLDLPLVRCVEAKDLDTHAAIMEYLTLLSPSGMDDEQD
jgi:hypothetical protein